MNLYSVVWLEELLPFGLSEDLHGKLIAADFSSVGDCQFAPDPILREHITESELVELRSSLARFSLEVHTVPTVLH